MGRSKPAAKPLPEIAVERLTAVESGSCIVRITMEKSGDEYAVLPVGGDDGPCYRLIKLSPKKAGEGDYDVSLSRHGRCDCKGFSVRGTCRHVRALLLLWSRDELYTRHFPLAQLQRQTTKESE